MDFSVETLLLGAAIGMVANQMLRMVWDTFRGGGGERTPALPFDEPPLPEEGDDPVPSELRIVLPDEPMEHAITVDTNSASLRLTLDEGEVLLGALGALCAELRALTQAVLDRKASPPTIVEREVERVVVVDGPTYSPTDREPKHPPACLCGVPGRRCPVHNPRS